MRMLGALIFALLLSSTFAWNFAKPDDEEQKLMDEFQEYINTPFEERPQEDHNSRHKRQLMELLSSVGSSGGSAITNLIPGFSDYGPAFMSLLNNFLGFMKCCAPINLPDVVSKLTLKCSDDLSNNFFATTGFLNRTEAEKKETIFMKSGSLGGFFEAELCTVRCVFGRMKMLTSDGLPSPTALKTTIPKLFKNFTSMFEPSLATCEKSYTDQYNAWFESKRPLSDSDRCWVSSAWVQCMYRELITNCPEEQIQAGSLCLQKLGPFFWGELPKQVGRFFAIVKAMIDIL
ncbi:uncharacterized protein LOC132193868 [Neocloeon triangulifer]|uniref:uncharacterized protein LOC132193868 n=1 Tax=Neocloeon triangulifer TaxID=2078957 RepID=UPI00286F4517|nr:uncharacterized protein LOC132193868 [Neocloeon triangulifer]